MKRIHEGKCRRQPAIWLASAIVAVLILGFTEGTARSAGQKGRMEPAFDRRLGPQDWRRESDRPALALWEKGNFDDQYIFAPHVIQQDGEFWMYYSGSQRCVDAGTYKGVAKDPEHPEKSDQRLFKLGLAKSTNGVHFTRHSADQVFSFGDDIHSVVTAAIHAVGDRHRG